MAGEPESIQAILRGRRSAGFVGRGGQLAVFRENFGLAAAERAYIFNVYGEGGVGKSTLLEQWRQIAREAGAAEAMVDERVFSAPEAMSALLEQLGQPRDAKDFRARYASFRKNRERLENDPEAPSELWSKIVRTGVKAGLHASKVIPGAAPVVELIDGDTAADAVDRVRQFLATKVRDSHEVRLMLYPTEELGPLFADALRRIASRRPVVLFFDTFEQSGIVLEDWLIELMSGTHGEIPATVSMVIAGRLPLDINRWAGLLRLIAPLPLAVFTDVETRQLLAAHEVTDARTIDTIMSLAGGLPLLVDMLAKSRPAGADEVDDPADTAVERFLKWEPDESRRQGALAGALPRRIDEDLLRAALGRDDVADLFAWLVHQAFLRGDRYHDVVRAPMLRWQRQRSPQRWREAHARLAAAHRDRAEAVDQFEADYHGLCARELTLDEALANAGQVVEAGIGVARRWAEMIMEAGRDGDDAETYEIGCRLFEAAARDENQAIELLTLLIDLGREDSVGQAVLLLKRARLRFLGNLDEMAIEDCTRALHHDPGLARAYALRAAARTYLDRYDEALADFGHALRLSPDDSWTLSRRGQAYCWMNRHDEALDDLDRAIELNGANGWAISQRGEVYRLLDRHDEALADFDRAVALSRTGDAWTIGSRGQTLLAMDRYDEALTDLDQAIELNGALAWLFDERGEVYRMLNRHQEAIADFDHAVELGGDSAQLFGRRGATHRAMRRYEQALDDLGRALELSNDYVWAMTERGAAYRSQKRYDEAVADFDLALELNPDNAWALAARGETYRLQERNQEALADFDRAIELGEDDAWTVGSRGQTHAALKDFAAALQDLNRSIALNGKQEWAVFERADVHRRLGDHEHALADVSRGIALDGEDGTYLVLRGVIHQELGQADEADADFRRAKELDPSISWSVVDGAIVFGD
ncbi:tetratricopeptide repeat protein [Actinoplanes sp. NPDC051513]|uniref:tetratricopeptide repeat protein n=1 Tax=Actinoplanes sp. NPDC051513 TaxID=3363908 RepID=UPI00379168D0